ncbi:MAG: DUF2178 domain-containing protein [Candidatus Buchananbacteria bacterium]|nr:DUF2178 domain-containing protein [Candidatus Buchananbacteria bacterium]
MTQKQYKICSLAIVIALSFSVSLSVTLNNYYLPAIFILSAVAGMYYCRKQLKTNNVLADERDYQISGQAARYSIYIYSWLGAIGTLALMAISEKDGVLYVLSQYLAFSVCFLLLVNAFLFNYLSKRGK